MGSGLKWPLHAALARCDGALVLALSGRVGQASAAALAAALAGAVEEGKGRLVVDLAGVDYISSAGLQAISSAASRCTELDGRLALCGIAEPVRIALDFGGVLTRAAIEPSRDLAAARIRA